MRVAYFDCFAGISGEMLLGALLHAGLSVDALRCMISKLPVSGYDLTVQTVGRKGLSVTSANVMGRSLLQNGNGLTKKNGHNTASSGPCSSAAARIISDSTLPDLVKQTSLAIFRKLEQTECSLFLHRDVARLPWQQTGAIITVVGVVAGLSLLGISRVECSPIHVGGGMTYSTEGLRPGLSPVSAEILRACHVPVYGSGVSGELVTPVGAAIITTVTSAFGSIPAMKISSVGYGAGKDDLKETLNLVRLFIGETTSQLVSTPGDTMADIATGFAANEQIAPELKSTPELSPLTVPAAASSAVAYRERITLALQGHQQSGRQRLAS